MNPDAYIKFYPGEFFAAIEGYADPFGWCYFCAIMHYWQVNHCEGLRNDDEFLRRICRCSAEDWQTIGPIIFDNNGKFFRQDESGDGLWKQKRAREEWEKAEKTIASLSAAGRAGMRKRWGK